MLIVSCHRILGRGNADDSRSLLSLKSLPSPMPHSPLLSSRLSRSRGQPGTSNPRSAHCSATKSPSSNQPYPSPKRASESSLTQE
jgi:hypothetical protein